MNIDLINKFKHNLHSFILFWIFVLGNFSLKQLSLRCKEDKNVERVLNKSKQIFPTGLFHLVKAPVKFTSIKDIRVVDQPDGPDGRKILFPDHFDGRIQIDVRSFI